MLFYVVLKPDKTPMQAPFIDMASAQTEIDRVEADLLKRNEYQIHAISQLSDLKYLNVSYTEKVTIAKFDGEYVGQAPVEVFESSRTI